MKSRRADRAQSATRPPGTGQRFPVFLLTIFALALALRLVAYRSAYDVFIDESIYAGIADNIAIGRGLTFEGQVTFYLHPPLLFFVDAVWLRVVGAAGNDPVMLVFAARIISIVFGAVNAVLISALVRRVVGTRPAVLVGCAYALEPFVIRFDTRVFLEAPTTTWLLAGFLVLLPLTGNRPVQQDGRRRSAVAGVLFGLALLTKEPSAVLCGLPLFVCFLRGRPLSRAHSATAGTMALLTYLPYPVIATLSDGSEWFEQKTVGIQRMLGLVQETGFNRAGAPSFTGRLTAQLAFFSTTYAVIGLGLFASIFILRTRPAPQQLVALWGLAAFTLLFYQVAVGTLEEQMFYFLVVPALATIGVALGGSPVPDRLLSLPVVRAGRMAMLFLYFAISCVVWTRVHATEDTEVSTTASWMSAHVPNGSRVLVLADGMQLVLPKFTVYTDPALVSGTDTWVVTSSLQIDQGYGFASKTDLALLTGKATPVHDVSGRSMGHLVVWHLNGATGR